MAFVPDQMPSPDGQVPDLPSQRTSAARPRERAPGRAVGGLSEPLFREFSARNFDETAAWDRLKLILRGNGGCFGIYGARGSGKSWLMKMAVWHANDSGGLGLLYPCPRRYSASAFLLTLSDMLASEIERRHIRNKPLAWVLRRGPAIILSLLAIPVVLCLVNLAQHVTDHSRLSAEQVVAATLPGWLQALIAAALVLLGAIYVGRLIRRNKADGKLEQAARVMRERVRYIATETTGTEIGISGRGGALAGALRRSRGRSLSERPATVASLVVGFRDLASQLAKAGRRPVVIGIDELDKIASTKAVRQLLRDIKGIFEIEGVHFIVSVSEEAATALQLGPLRLGGRDEFDSSFYAVLTVDPMEPAEAARLLASRGLANSASLAAVLCVLSGGNRREFIRMADFAVTHGPCRGSKLYESAVVPLLGAESVALLNEVIRTVQIDKSKEDDLKYQAWMALPRADFGSVERFVNLAYKVFERFWEPQWGHDERWASHQESWRRLLVRLAVGARLLDSRRAERSQQSDIGILVMASKDASVARSMLVSAFGTTLQQYRGPLPSQAQ